MVLFSRAAAGGVDGPNRLVREFWTALKSNDEKAMKACLTVADGTPPGAVDLLVETQTRPRLFLAACKEKFGGIPEGLDHDVATNAGIDLAIQAYEGAEARVTADRVTLKVAGFDGGRVLFATEGATFRRVGGEWRIDATEDTTFGQDLEQPVGRRTRRWYYRQVTDALTEVTADIKAGRLKSLGEVKPDLDERLARIVKESETPPGQDNGSRGR